MSTRDTAVGYQESLSPVGAALVIVMLLGIAGAGVLARSALGRLGRHRTTAA